MPCPALLLWALWLRAQRYLSDQEGVFSVIRVIFTRVASEFFHANYLLGLLEIGRASFRTNSSAALNEPRSPGALAWGPDLRAQQSGSPRGDLSHALPRPVAVGALAESTALFE